MPKLLWNPKVARVHGLGPDVQLLPGQVHDVPEKVLKQFEGNAIVDALIESGELSLVEDDAAPADTKPKRKAKAEKSSDAPPAPEKASDAPPAPAPETK